MNLMELFKSFHKRAIVNKYPPSVRVLYDALLFDFNGKYWPEHCIYTERGLSEMTGLSQATTHRALTYLCQRGHLSVRASKNQSVIRITDESPVNHERITDESPMNHTAERPILHVREDKDIRQDNKTMDIAHARTDSVSVDDELVQTWLANRGAFVTAELLSYLSTLVGKYGTARTEEFIKSAASNFGGEYRMSVEFLRKHIRLLEGGSQREQRRKVVPINQQYSQPDTRFDSEFGL